jgi:hypothetical protein
MEVQNVEYEFSQSCTTAMLRHDPSAPLRLAKLWYKDGSKEGRTCDIEIGDVESRIKKGEFFVQRQYTLSMPMKGFKAEVSGSIDTDNDIHTCDIEILRQTANGWEVVADPVYTLTLFY